MPNPDATAYGYWNTPVVYNNNLYIFYLPADGTHHLAQYQGASNSLKVFPNPDAGTGYWDQPVVYDNNLYFQYYNAQSVFQLGYFDGSALRLISNPAGVYNGAPGNNGYTGNPIVWNDTLYMQFASVPYSNAGNLAIFASSNTGICPGSNTTFVSDVTGASYQWQVDNGSGIFTNLSNVAPYSAVATDTLNLTAPPTSLYGYKYRCVVNGNTYSQTFTLKFASNWVGTISTAWETTGNWSCGQVPDANTDVYISAGNPNSPLVNSTRSVRSLHLQNGATVGVANNQHLTLTGR